MSKYIYAFTDSHYDNEVIRVLDDTGLYTLSHDGISAVVSDVNYDTIEFLDKESLAYVLVEHQKKIEIIMSGGCSGIIPVQFGTIVESDNDVIRILRYGLKLIKKTLSHVENLVECDLVAVWNDFNEVIGKISNNPGIIELKERLALKSDYLDSDCINIGRLIKEKLDEQNNFVKTEITDSLLACCVDMKYHETMNDQMPINTAFLLKKSKVEIFCEIIEEFDKKYNNSLNFKIVGPLPCYSFYTIECKVLNNDDIKKACNTLGIDHLSSVNAIKKAYRNMADKFHPDKNVQGDNNIKRFLEIQNAYKLMLEYSDINNYIDETIRDNYYYHIKIKE